MWAKESELSAEIDKKKAIVDRAEKNLDHATPGVSNPFHFLRSKINYLFIFYFELLLNFLKCLAE